MPHQRKGHYNIAVFGLDSSGKTRAILRLNGNLTSPPKAAWGFNSTTIPFQTQKLIPFCCFPLSFTERNWLTFYDVGGHEKIRKIWNQYYADVYGCVFVVDCAAPQRFPEAQAALHQMALDPLMIRKPILIIANRALACGVSTETIRQALDIPKLIQTSQEGSSYKLRDSLVVIRSCEIDDASIGLKQGIEWLIKAIQVNYPALSVRVSNDIQEQEKKWHQQKSKPSSNKSLSDSTIKSSKVHPEPTNT